MGLANHGSSRSWTVNHSHPDKTSGETSGIKKFRLLLWKNYKIQIRHKVQTVTEILLPLLFTAVLVIVRNIVPSTFITEPTIYKPLILENSPPGIVQTKCDTIYFTPKHPAVEALMQKVNDQYFRSQGLEYNFTGFDTEEELVTNYIKAAKDEVIHSSGDIDSTVPVLAGVVFKNQFINGTFPKLIEYTLRFPATQRSSFEIISEKFGIKPAWFTELIYPLFQLLGPRSKDHLGGGLPGYSEEGFLYVQYAIDRTLTRELLNSTELEHYNKYDIKLQRFPYPPYIDDKYLFALQGWLPLIIMLSFIYPVVNIAKSVVYEKEKRLKEYMKMMGLPNWLHWLAWFAKSYLFLLISVGLMTLMLKTKLSPSQDLAVLPESDGTVIFFVFVVFTFSLICFSFFISTLFSRASAGATAAGVLWFVFYVPYGFLQPRYNLLSRGTKMLSCFLTNTAIAFACQILCMFEGTGAGLQWSTIFQGSGPDDNFSMGDCLIMMIVNGIFYLTAALYIEAVHPGEFGVPLPFYYPFTKWFWTGRLRISHCDENYEVPLEKSDATNELIETEPTNASPGIEIKGLTKVYDNNKIAVKNLSLNFYEGQITAFLGHNGAGKTTTLSILSGLFPPTAGTALVNHYDISRDIHAARSSLGLCPQYDILFDELTVEEHFRFYCLMKGCKATYVEREINRMIKALGLESKRHAESQTLSGGMKRKLSVGIAFCGGSKVVLLDEPSSGMDPGARRSTWDLIKSEKKKRTIVLSTHFMEEADVLGDRIAIMANGEIQCCGSSLFLKKKFGGGYHLIIVKDAECEVDRITNVIKKTIPDTEVDQDVGAELSYSLPEDKSHLFPDMFDELETRKKELCIASYGASITTMEEVFIRVGRHADARMIEELSENVNANQSLNLTIDNHDLSTDSKLKLYQDEPPRNEGLRLTFQQLMAMLTKKVIYASRNRKLLLAQMGIPILYLILILIILKNLPGISDPPAHQLTLRRYEKLGKTITSVRCPDTEEVCRSYKKFVGEDFLLDVVNQNQTFTDFILEKEIQDLVTVNFRYILGFDQRQTNSNSTPNELVGFFNNQPFHSPPLSMNFITNSILLPTNHSVSITNHPFPLSSIDTLKQIGSLYSIGFQIGYNIAFGMSFLAASFSVFLITERETRSKHIQFVSGVEFPLYWIASFVVDFIQYTIPCFGVMGILLLFQVEEFFSVQMQLYVLLLLMCYGLAVIPLMYLWSFAFTVPSSGFTRLVLFNIFTGMASMLTVVIIQIPEFNLERVADILNTIFLIFPNYALGMGIVQLSTNYQISRDCAKFNLEFVCPVFPNAVCCSKLKSNFLDWERVGVGKNVAFLLLSFAIYLTILFVVESKILSKLSSYRKKIKQHVGISKDDEDLTGLEDSDVLEEMKRIQNTEVTALFKDNTLVVRNLTKHYNKFLAVDHINLGVQRGECFGLLGTNGAGKTSTFKMLTGDLPISEGDAYVCSRSVRNELKSVHEVLGYCPQFDALIEEMTGRETIQMYARLRGIKESFIEHLTNCLGETLLFSQHMDKRVSSYSGGNKRKLSTAIALIGSPPIIFLDEMTTGMDPVARRHMWTAISKIRDSGTSIVLTSHSMNECEALCTRLAIMVNGTFRCLGSPQQLKNKFGEGYTLIAQITPKGLSESEPFTREKQELGRRRSSIMSMRRTKSPQQWESELEELRTYIEGSFSGCTMKDIHPGFVHYQVAGEGVSWGEMFRKMEVAKQKFNLEAYSVGQCSLEQVFLAFAKAQINVD